MTYALSGKKIADSKAKLGSGGRFAALKSSVAQEYEKKGVSAQKAQKIGAAVAAKQGRKKYGAKEMNLLARKGRAKREVGPDKISM